MTWNVGGRKMATLSGNYKMPMDIGTVNHNREVSGTMGVCVSTPVANRLWPNN